VSTSTAHSRLRAVSFANRKAIACVILLALAVTSCARQPGRDDPADQAEQARPATPSILQNMPVNSEERCVGITIVVAALLEGNRTNGDRQDRPEELAKRIYATLTTGKPVHYSRYLLSNGRSLAIDSREALDTLSTLVADLYKEDYRRLIQTEEGRRRLFQAAGGFVRTREELEGLLDRHTDKTDVFLAGGIRRFPDGTVKETHHAVLIRNGPSGELLVFDPNDPGVPIRCRVETDEDGLVLEWTCRYKDTGMITTQRYHIIPKDRYFRTVLRETP
jgi:hypothetical protein